MKVQKRSDDYLEKRKHLQDLTDEQLKEKFWGLIERVVDPLLDLSKENTSVSIERSVLLRMGFSSMDAKAIVEKVEQNGLLKFGAGHVVYLASKDNNISIKEAGLGIMEDKFIQDVAKKLG